jgi:hypothetical protein
MQGAVREQGGPVTNFAEFQTDIDMQDCRGLRPRLPLSYGERDSPAREKGWHGTPPATRSMD